MLLRGQRQRTEIRISARRGIRDFGDAGPSQDHALNSGAASATRSGRSRSSERVRARIADNGGSHMGFSRDSVGLLNHGGPSNSSRHDGGGQLGGIAFDPSNTDPAPLPLPDDLHLLATTASQNDTELSALFGGFIPPSDVAIAVDEPSLSATVAPSHIDDLYSLFGFDINFSGTTEWCLAPQEGDIFGVLNTNALNSPTASAWDIAADLRVGNTGAPQGEEAMVQAGTGAEHHRIVITEQIHGSPSEIQDGQPYESPWPHIYKPRATDSSVDLPPMLSNHAVALTPFSSTTIADHTRKSMMTLIDYSHRAAWSPVDISDFPSTQTLSICVNLFYRHFHDCVPVLDKAKFKITEAPPLLIMAMVAIGAMYKRDGDQRLGIALNELVRRGVLFIREYDHRFEFDIGLTQASLLQAYFGLFCGSQRLFQQSESLRGALVTACKRMHLLRPGRSAVEILQLQQAPISPGDLEMAILQDETRLRLGWAIYLFDAQLACLLNLPAQLSLAEITALLPVLEPPGYHSEQAPIMFAAVLRNLLAEGVLSDPLTDISYSIIAHTLYRLCLDASALQSIVPSATQSHRYNLAFADNIKHNPQLLLDRLAAHALLSPASASPPLLSCIALAHHAHMNFTRVGFLEKVKVAAGKAGTPQSRSAAAESLAHWLNADRSAARNIFAHAAMLGSLLTRYNYDTPFEVVWHFDAALCMWAVLNFSTESIVGSSGANLPNTSIPLVSISWSPSQKIDDWIMYGGGAEIQGLGDLSKISISDILRAYASRLEAASWGLAGQYRKVLLKLMPS